MPLRRFTSPTLRLLDLGTVPWLQSQSIHHAVAQVFDEDTPDTLVVVRPDRPYVCVGPHQVGAALSPTAVRRSGLPVVRRRLGGGTVMVTSEQTFFVLVAHRRRLSLPSAVAHAWCLEAGVAAYRRLGVEEAVLSGLEIQGHGRKLCGSGLASIGEASVFGGNIIHAFDASGFVDLLRMPSGPSRAVLADEVGRQMGSVEQSSGRRPAASRVTTALREAAEEVWGVRLVPGELAERELAAVPEVERWLRRPDLRRANAGVARCWKVRSGAGVLGVRLERPWRTRALVVVRERRIAAVMADGRTPRAALDALGELLVGASTEELSALAARGRPFVARGDLPLLKWLSAAVRIAT